MNFQTKKNINNSLSNDMNSTSTVSSNPGEEDALKTSGNDQVKNALGEMFQTKSIKYKVIGIILLAILTVTITVVNLMRKSSGDTVPEGTIEVGVDSGADYDPSAEVNVPINEEDDVSEENSLPGKAINKAQSPPENVVRKFLEFNLKGDRISASQLISPRVEIGMFTPTLEGIDDETSLYDKDFSYDIYNTFIEKNGPLSRVSVWITKDDASFSNVYILIWENDKWLLLDMETYEPVEVEG